MKVSFYRGNPGFAEDIAAVAALFKSVNFVDERSSESRSADIALCYSYGAYRALRAAETGSIARRAIILIAPYLRPEVPLSLMARMLLAVPPLRRSLVSRKWPEWKNDLIGRMFRTDQEVSGKKFIDEISQEKLWHQVIADKVAQEQDPLRSPKLTTAVYVIYGSSDVTSPLEKIERDLKFLNLRAHYREIRGAPHGMLWTHPREVAAQIQSILNDLIPKESL